MKKKALVIVVAVALAALAVPALAFAGVLQHAPFAPAGDAIRPVAQQAMQQAASTRADAIAESGQRLASVVDHRACGAFVDADADGVCDTCDRAGSACPGYVDADGDGVCDNRNARGGACSAFVDADGDGVCDTCNRAGAACPGYVDGNGDGVCDNRADGASGNGASGYCGGRAGDGYGYGHGCGQGNGRGHGCNRG